MTIKRIGLISLGVLWICIALNFFLLPHSIASAGVGSIGYLIETGLAIDRHLIVWGINLIMLGLAFLFLERKVFINTVFGSLLFPVILAWIPEWMVWEFYPASLILGSFFFSLGIFTHYCIGASNGGVTIPPLIFEKYFGIKKAVGIFLTNTTIIVLNFLVFGLREAIISACSIYLIAFFMNILLKGQRQFVKRKEAKESTLASAPVKEKRTAG
ncbi:YitT family protein [Enterococcus gallinarum]|uniref:YitT family protein n=1 Tax=Enterococcus gallinarum TaxID=1353 RepID=UPI0035E01EC9